MPRIEPFERHAGAYDDWFEKHAELYQAELEVIRQVVPPAGAEGLEVGVGSGKFAGPLGIRIGVEPSPRMAERARRLGIEVHPGVAERLPFSDDRFYYVLMVTTVCFVDDVVDSFQEAFRVLRRGGCLIVGFVDKDSDLGKRYRVNRGQSRFYEHATFYSASEVSGFLSQAGFEIDTVAQAIIPGERPGTVREGFGRGAFVVIKGTKRG